MAEWFKKVVAAFLVVALAFSQVQAQHRFTLIETGTYHGQDVRLKQPATWVGVYCKDNSCRAHATRVRSTRVPDPLGDEDPKEPTGTSIEVFTREQPLFLVRGVSGSPRLLATVFVGEWSMGAGDQRSIALSGANYTLGVEGDKLEGNPLPQGARLIFSNGPVKQELFSIPKDGNDPHITVLWVGDLDGDGKPDLYLDSSWHYNVSHKVLWLSSLAKPGQIVGQAAFFETTGC